MSLWASQQDIYVSSEQVKLCVWMDLWVPQRCYVCSEQAKMCVYGWICGLHNVKFLVSKQRHVCVCMDGIRGGRAPQKLLGFSIEDALWICKENALTGFFWNFVLSIFFLQKSGMHFSLCPHNSWPHALNMFSITPHFDSYMLCSTLSSWCR
jgi:hypothetical protein